MTLIVPALVIHPIITSQTGHKIEVRTYSKERKEPMETETIGKNNLVKLNNFCNTGINTE